jgi:hypothetical protein
MTTTKTTLVDTFTTIGTMSAILIQRNKRRVVDDGDEEVDGIASKIGRASTGDNEEFDQDDDDYEDEDYDPDNETEDDDNADDVDDNKPDKNDDVEDFRLDDVCNDPTAGDVHDEIRNCPTTVERLLGGYRYRPKFMEALYHLTIRYPLSLAITEYQMTPEGQVFKAQLEDQTELKKWLYSQSLNHNHVDYRSQLQQHLLLLQSKIINEANGDSDQLREMKARIETAAAFSIFCHQVAKDYHSCI